MKQRGKVVSVIRDKKVLYSVTLNGKKNFHRRGFDEAFLAGNCLVVRRNIRQILAEEYVYPSVSRIETYQVNGSKRIYRESKDLILYLVFEHDIINSPDHSWAIIPENSEETFWGYDHISPDCKITQIRFPDFNSFTFDWDFSDNRIFPDADTLKFPAIKKRLTTNGETKPVEIYIFRNSKYRIEEVIK